MSFNNAELGPKRLQLLREVRPGISRVAVLSNTNNPGQAPQIAALKRVSSQLGHFDLVINLRTARTLGLTSSAICAAHREPRHRVRLVIT